MPTPPSCCLSDSLALALIPWASSSPGVWPGPALDLWLCPPPQCHCVPRQTLLYSVPAPLTRALLRPLQRQGWLGQLDRMAGGMSKSDEGRPWAQSVCSNTAAAGAKGCSPLRASGSPRIRFKVSAGIFSKASLVGARRVNWPSPSSRVLSPEAATAACGKEGRECFLKALGFSEGKRRTRLCQSLLREPEAWTEAQDEETCPPKAGPLPQPPGPCPAECQPRWLSLSYACAFLPALSRPLPLLFPVPLPFLCFSDSYYFFGSCLKCHFSRESP